MLIRKGWRDEYGQIGDILELVQRQKETDTEEMHEEEKYFSASEILSWEKKHSKANGKYIEALQAKVSNTLSFILK